MMDLIEKAPIVFVLVFLNYWIMEWIKRVLPLKGVYKQPISLIIGTLISMLALSNYNFRSIDLGVPNSLWLDYFLQGGILAAVSGILYDKFFKDL